MNKHLTEEQIIGYIHHTLTDAQRESINHHLTTCPVCRGQLADHESTQRVIRNTLHADMKALRPPTQIPFTAIKQISGVNLLWERTGQLLSNAFALAALALLVITLIALFGSGRPPDQGDEQDIESAAPITSPIESPTVESDANSSPTSPVSSLESPTTTDIANATHTLVASPLQSPTAADTATSTPTYPPPTPSSTSSPYPSATAAPPTDTPGPAPTKTPVPPTTLPSNTPLPTFTPSDTPRPTPGR